MISDCCAETHARLSAAQAPPALVPLVSLPPGSALSTDSLAFPRSSVVRGPNGSLPSGLGTAPEARAAHCAPAKSDASRSLRHWVVTTEPRGLVGQ